MKTVKVKCLDLDWDIANVPETAAEYDELAKKKDACVEAAVQKELYHGTFGDIRGGLTSVVEEHLKSDKDEEKSLRVEKLGSAAASVPADVLSWDSKEVAERNEAGEPTEFKPLGDAAWLNKILAHLGKKAADLVYLQPRVKVVFDPTPHVRQPAGPKTPSKNHLAAADALLQSHGTERNGKKVDVNAIAAKLAELNPEDKSKVKLELDENGLPKRESLARLIGANEARKRAEENLANKYADAATLV